MSKADEMFEKLGYKKENIYNNNIVYCKTENIAIEFDCNNKTFYAIDEPEPKDITMQELQAINEKCKELGWI